MTRDNRAAAALVLLSLAIAIWSGWSFEKGRDSGEIMIMASIGMFFAFSGVCVAMRARP